MPQTRNTRRKYNSSDLTFKFENGTKNTPINLTYIQIINPTSIQLQYPNISKEDLENIKHLTCFVNRIDETRSPRSAIVEIKWPHTIPRITEWQVNNWETLSFNWETNENKSTMFYMKYEAWIKNDSSQGDDYLRCNVIRGNECIFEKPFDFSSPHHVLYVKVNGSTEKDTRILETVSSSDMMRINLTDALKPAPVGNISLLQDDNSICVKFYPPQSNRNITYEMSTTCKNSSFTQLRNITPVITVKIFDKSYLVSESLVGLPPYSNCTLSIRGISTKGGKWSESSYVDFQTMENVPLEAPEVNTCGFQVMHENGTDMHVIVYFKPLSEERSRGKVISYQVKIRNVHIDINIEMDSSKTTHSQILLRNRISEEYEISINAKTGRGYNKTLKMPNIKVSLSKRRKEFARFLLKKEFTVIILNDSTVKISWRLNQYHIVNDDYDKSTKIFLFWCKGNQTKKKCEDVLNWKELLFSETKTSELINLSYGEQTGRLIFGFGIEQNGNASGIIWNDCIYDRRSYPPKPAVEVIDRSSSDIKVKISKPLCRIFDHERSFIISYIFYFCPFSNYSEDDHDGSQCLSEVNMLEVKGYVAMVTLEPLDPNQSYLILVESVAAVGRSDNVTLRAITLAESHISLTIIMLVMSFIIIFVLMLIISLFFIFGPFNRFKLWLNVTIVIPLDQKEKIITNVVRQSHDLTKCSENYVDTISQNLSDTIPVHRSMKLDSENDDSNLIQSNTDMTDYMNSSIEKRILPNILQIQPVETLSSAPFEKMETLPEKSSDKTIPEIPIILYNKPNETLDLPAATLLPLSQNILRSTPVFLKDTSCILPPLQGSSHLQPSTKNEKSEVVPNDAKYLPKDTFSQSSIDLERKETSLADSECDSECSNKIYNSITIISSKSLHRPNVLLDPSDKSDCLASFDMNAILPPLSSRPITMAFWEKKKGDETACCTISLNDVCFGGSILKPDSNSLEFSDYDKCTELDSIVLSSGYAVGCQSHIPPEFLPVRSGMAQPVHLPAWLSDSPTDSCTSMMTVSKPTDSLAKEMLIPSRCFSDIEQEFNKCIISAQQSIVSDDDDGYFSVKQQ